MSMSNSEKGQSSKLSGKHLKERTHQLDEGYISEKIYSLKNSRRAYVGKITQNINKLTKYMNVQNKNSLDFETCLQKLQKYMYKIRTVSDSLIELTNDENELQNISDFYTQQDFRVIEITKSVSNYNSSPLKLLNNDELFSTTSFSTKSKSKTAYENPLPSLTGSKTSKTSYLSVNERRKTAEHAKLLAQQAEERTKRKLELLEQSFQFEKQKILDAEIEAKNNAELAALDIKTDELNISNPEKTSSKDLKNEQKLFEEHNSIKLKEQLTLSKTNSPKTFQKTLSKPYEKINENFLTNSKTCVDSFIEYLVEGKETVINHVAKHLTPQEAIKQELELRNLPPVDLIRFDGNPIYWPEFIDNFYHRVHKKSSFNDSLRMIHLINSLDGEAKKLVKSVGTNGYFYATALKVLKKDFGNPLVVSHLKLKKLFDQKQINIKDKFGLRAFHQQLRICISWLSSIDYSTPLTSYENLVKPLAILPIKYQSDFFKHTKDFNMLDGTINLIFLEEWLEKQLQTIFNPLANILAAEIKNKQNDKNPKLVNAISGAAPKNDSKHQTKSSSKKKFTCWLCQNDHKLMFCDDFLNKDVKNRKQFVIDQKLCFNCLGKKS